MHDHAKVNNLLKELGRFVRRNVGPAANQKNLPFPTHVLGSRFLLPRTSRDYAAEVGDLSNSNLVMITMNWIARTFPEAPLILWRVGADGIDEPFMRHEVNDLLQNPNPFYSGQLLMSATAVDLNFSGNAYWYKVRNEFDEVVQLWYIPSTLIEPQWPDNPTAEQKRNGEAFISHYSYKPNPEKPSIDWPVRDVVHIRYKINRKNIRIGESPISTSVREIFTDEEATNFTASMLDNFGVPGVVISPRTGSEDVGVYGEEQGEAIKHAFTDRFGGDSRGKPLVMTLPTNIDVVSWSPEQMNLRELRLIPEERVSALLGIPAIVLGLGAGLERSTFTNFSEAREAAIETHTIPLYRLVGGEVTRQLLPDFFTTERQRRNYKIAHDVSVMRILQEDETKKFERFSSIFERGMISRWDAKRAVGISPTEEDKVYKLKLNEVFIDATMTPEEWRENFETLLEIKKTQVGLNEANIALIEASTENIGVDPATVDQSPEAETATEDSGASDSVGGVTSSSFNYQFKLHKDHEHYRDRMKKQARAIEATGNFLYGRMFEFYKNLSEQVSDAILEKETRAVQANSIIPDNMKQLYAGILANTVLIMSGHMKKSLNVDYKVKQDVIRKVRDYVESGNFATILEREVDLALQAALPISQGYTDFAEHVKDGLMQSLTEPMGLIAGSEEALFAVSNIVLAGAVESSDRISARLLYHIGEEERVDAITDDLWVRVLNQKAADFEILLEVTPND